MPKNTLRKLLQSAWNKIPVNYPLTNTCYNGFYRETLKDADDNYISFGEAFIESVRGTVILNNDRGQIKILKSRGGYLPGRDSTTSIHFYGGIFMATSDFVQNRADFINPSKFDNYSFWVLKDDNYYKISFSKKKHGESGYFLLDTLSLAYTEAAYSRERNETEVLYKRLNADYYCKFIKVDNRYFLKYKKKRSEGFDKIKKKKMVHGGEYLATAIFPDCDNKIPDDEQINYFDVFIDKAGDYSDSYWNDYNIIETNSALRQSQLSQEKINSIIEQTTQKNRKEKLVSFILKFSIKYGVTYSASQIPSGIYDFQLSSINQRLEKEFTNTVNWGLNTTLVYFFNHHWGAMLSSENRINNNNVYTNTVIGTEYKKKLNPVGQPTYLSLKGGIGRATSLLKIGSFNNDGVIEWGSKKLKKNTITAYTGERSWILKPTFGFSRHIKKKISLFIDFSYCIPLFPNEVIVLKEKSGIFRKTATERIPQIDTQIYRNGQLVNKTGIQSPRFNISLGINLLR